MNSNEELLAEFIQKKMSLTSIYEFLDVFEEPYKAWFLDMTGSEIREAFRIAKENETSKS